MTSDPPAPQVLLPDRVFITRSAHKAMVDETRRHRDSVQIENETGGILIGRRLEARGRIEILIAVATSPGENALHHAIEFNPDVEYVNEQLREWCAVYPRMDYIGTWHKHPPRYPTFSRGDMRTAHALFDDSSYKMIEIVNPITWSGDGDVTIRYYYMNRAMAKEGLPFEQIPAKNILVIDDYDEIVIKESTPALDGLARERIAKERQLLIEQGYQVKLHQEEYEYYFTIADERLPDTSIYLTAPPGYPRIPPSLTIERNGQGIIGDDDGIIAGWMLNPGTSHLVDVAEAVVKNLLKPAPRTSSPRQILTWGLVPAILVALAIMGVLFFRTSSDYTARWAAIDQALAAPSITNITAAIEDLTNLSKQDPQGAVFGRNREAATTLAHAYRLLGDMYMRQPTPQADLAGLQYDAALKLGAASAEDVQGAQFGQTAVTALNSSLRASAEAQVRQQTREELWQSVREAENAGDLNRQITLLDGLRSNNVTQDPNGVATDLLLGRALAARAEQLYEQQQPDQARQLALRARTLLPQAEQQQTSDLLATILLDQADQLSAAGSWTEAQQAYGQVAEIQPTPQQSLLARSTAGIEQAKAGQLDAELRAYDQAHNDPCGAAQQAILNIQKITGTLTPEPASYPDPPYSTRLRTINELLAQSRLNCAAVRQRNGSLEAAREQYNQVRAEDQAAPEQLKSQALARLKTLNQADQLWTMAGRALDARLWEEARPLLVQLRALDGFGPNARRPGTRLTVGELLDQVDRGLNPTAVPVTPTQIDLSPTPTSIFFASPTPEPPPNAVTYRVDVQEISLDELVQLASGANLTGINTYVAGPGGLHMQIVNMGIGRIDEFDSDVRLIKLGSGQVEIRVVDDGSGLPIMVTGNNTVSPQAGTYYKITVSRV